MSKYDSLWEYVSKTNQEKLKLTFEEIEGVSTKVDHSFLGYKKELLDYGYMVGKISMKEKTIEFIKTK